MKDKVPLTKQLINDYDKSCDPYRDPNWGTPSGNMEPQSLVLDTTANSLTVNIGAGRAIVATDTIEVVVSQGKYVVTSDTQSGAVVAKDHSFGLAWSYAGRMSGTYTVEVTVKDRTGEVVATGTADLVVENI